MINDNINVIISESISVNSGDVLIIRGFHHSQFQEVAAQLKERFAGQGIDGLTIIGLPILDDSVKVFERLDKEAMREKGWIRIEEAQAHG